VSHWQKEGEKDSVTLCKGFIGPDEHSARTDIFGKERHRPVLDICLVWQRRARPVKLSRRNIQELLHFAVQQGRINRHGEDGIGTALFAPLTVGESVLADSG